MVVGTCKVAPRGIAGAVWGLRGVCCQVSFTFDFSQVTTRDVSFLIKNSDCGAQTFFKCKL